MKITDQIASYGYADKNVVLVLEVGSSVKYETVVTNNTDIIIVFHKLKQRSAEIMLSNLSKILLRQGFKIFDVLSDVVQYRNNGDGQIISVCPVSEYAFKNEIRRLSSGVEPNILGSIVPWTIAGRFPETYLEDLSMGQVLYDPRNFYSAIKKSITTIPSDFKIALKKELVKYIQYRVKLVSKTNYRLISKLAMEESAIAFIRLTCLNNNIYFPSIKYLDAIKERFPGKIWMKLEHCLNDQADADFFKSELENEYI